MNCDYCKREPGRFRMAKIPLKALVTTYAGQEAGYAEIVDVCPTCHKKLKNGEAPANSGAAPNGPSAEEPEGKSDEPSDPGDRSQPPTG